LPSTIAPLKIRDKGRGVDEVNDDTGADADTQSDHVNHRGERMIADMPPGDAETMREHRLLFLGVFEYVAGLAVQYFANRFEGVESYTFCLAGLEYRQVNIGKTDLLRQFV
jgi:hypothetical protein